MPEMPTNECQERRKCLLTAQARCCPHFRAGRHSSFQSSSWTSIAYPRKCASGIRWHFWHWLALLAFVGISGIRWHFWHWLALLALVGISGIRWHFWHSLALLALVGISGIRWHFWHSLAFLALVGTSGIRWHFWHWLAFLAFVGISGIGHWRIAPHPMR
jgi:hypothetical protein